MKSHKKILVSLENCFEIKSTVNPFQIDLFQQVFQITLIIF